MEMKLVNKPNVKGKDNTPPYMLIASVGSSFKSWIQLLFINKFKVDLRHIPYVILITILSLFFAPFMWLEKLIFDKKIKNTKLKEPVFIIGPMRSGTTFLHYLMCQDPQFSWLRTAETIFPRIFLTLGPLVNFLVKTFLPKKRPMDNLPIDIDCPQEEEFGMANLCVFSPYNGAYFPNKLKEFYHKYSFFDGTSEKETGKWKKVYKHFMQKISFKNDGKKLLSKSIVNAGRIKYVLELFPDAKFIFLYRNPYKLILSSIKLFKRNVLPHMAYHQIDDKTLEEDLIDIAANLYSIYEKEKHLIDSKNLIEITFEDFVKDPVSELKQIYESLNIGNFTEATPYFEEYLKHYENYRPDNYYIDDELEEKIYNKLRAAFKKFGYDRHTIN